MSIYLKVTVSISYHVIIANLDYHKMNYLRNYSITMSQVGEV